MKIITIGRQQGNTIIINDQFVGRNHLQMIQDDSDNIQLIDLYSANGTFVNGRKLESGESVYLLSTDIVRIGNTILPWKSYFTADERMNNEPDTIQKTYKKPKTDREKKPANWRGVLSVVMTIFSLLFMIMMLLRMFKIIG